eukprot:GHVN01027483.1.p1 GENE.GHVN01027483.1~~GHVN01027483.1.p1  ORF type:complete len:732 (-),score=162.95 GHVN01027483.1:377-2572(-)
MLTSFESPEGGDGDAQEDQGQEQSTLHHPSPSPVAFVDYSHRSPSPSHHIITTTTDPSGQSEIDAVVLPWGLTRSTPLPAGPMMRPGPEMHPLVSISNTQSHSLHPSTRTHRFSDDAHWVGHTNHGDTSTVSEALLTRSPHRLIDPQTGLTAQSLSMSSSLPRPNTDSHLVQPPPLISRVRQLAAFTQHRFLHPLHRIPAPSSRARSLSPAVGNVVPVESHSNGESHGAVYRECGGHVSHSRNPVLGGADPPGGVNVPFTPRLVGRRSPPSSSFNGMAQLNESLLVRQQRDGRGAGIFIENGDVVGVGNEDMVQAIPVSCESHINCFICLDEEFTAEGTTGGELVSCCTQCHAVIHRRCWRDLTKSQKLASIRARFLGHRVPNLRICTICKTGYARISVILQHSLDDGSVALERVRNGIDSPHSSHPEDFLQEPLQESLFSVVSRMLNDDDDEDEDGPALWTPAVTLLNILFCIASLFPCLILISRFQFNSTSTIMGLIGFLYIFFVIETLILAIAQRRSALAILIDRHSRPSNRAPSDATSSHDPLSLPNEVDITHLTDTPPPAPPTSNHHSPNHSAIPGGADLHRYSQPHNSHKTQYYQPTTPLTLSLSHTHHADTHNYHQGVEDGTVADTDMRGRNTQPSQHMPAFSSPPTGSLHLHPSHLHTASLLHTVNPRTRSHSPTPHTRSRTIDISKLEQDTRRNLPVNIQLVPITDSNSNITNVALTCDSPH